MAQRCARPACDPTTPLAQELNPARKFQTCLNSHSSSSINLGARFMSVLDPDQLERSLVQTA
jgi:hypothetical protein